MNTAETHVLLENYITQSARELFLDVSGFAFEPVEKSDGFPEITAVLGIAGSRVAGSATLGTSTICLAALAAKANSDMPEDWLGELANQLVGRFKRRIVAHGVDFSLGTPTLISGERLHVLVSLSHKPPLTVHLQSAIGRVEIWLEFELRDGCELSAEPQDDGSLIEGEALLF
jgi:CheY-specific phosphatase CheX